MVKFLLLLAFTAQALFLASSTGEVQRSEHSFPKSSSSISSRAESSTTSTTSSVGPCVHGHAYQQASSTSVASSSSSSSSSSLSDTTYIGPPVYHPDCRSCRKNEIWVQCPEAVCVPKTCKDVGFPIPCFDLRPDGKCPGEAGCICKEGYVRNYKGICIPMKHCPSCGGDKNAESGCGTHCNRLCSNYNKKNVSCIQDCFYNSCECKAGYVYDQVIKKCVSPRDCTPPLKCKKNEVYDTCPAPCPFRTCGINDAAVSCVQPLPNGHPDCALPKCRCRDGFFKNDVGNCVRWKDCPKCKKPNEIYDPCPAPCPPRTCGVNEALILCLVPPQLGDPECEPGCRCKDGFVRNYTGICIPKDQCPKCPEPNQVFDPCISPCPPRHCDVDPRLIKCAKPLEVGDPLCEAGCRCADGYVTNSEGVCILKEDCPKCTKPHEVYDPCPKVCSPNTCESIGKNYTCPHKNTVEGKNEKKDGGEIIHACEGKCVCEEGYFRNKIGECISKHDCLKCRGPHEYFTCGPACDNVCELIDKQNQTHCPIINKTCNKKCYCEEGYARDENNICIRIKDCKASCGGDPKAVPGCGVYCNQRCRDVGKKPGACILICYSDACDCLEGYYLDENTGKCVLPKQCTPQCPKNELYSKCVQSNCSPQNCAQLGFPIPCPRINPKYCKEGCLCKEGFVRNEYGICIRSTQCPSCGGDENAQAGCGGNCNRHCSDIGKEPGFCTLICEINGCECKEGYYYDDNIKKCVKPEQCTPTCGINEEYNECANNNCNPQSCTQVEFPIPDCPRSEDPKNCQEGCQCKSGFTRNYEGVCVPIEECPPQCRENEWYSECTQGQCSVQNCSQVGFPIPCPEIDPEYCQKGCLCKEGYARNEKGICVPVNECPSCEGDSNKVAGCGVYCNQRCRDIGMEPGACIAICYENACNCRDGYFLDENTGYCVLPEHCTPQCPENEWYSDCTQGQCSVKNCTQVGFPISCPRIDPKYCIKGCLCKEGYARNEKGICVPVNECPSCEGDSNKVAGCGVYCNQRCRDIGMEPGACIAICYENACNCRDGYFLDENTGYCVLPEHCTPQCPENEWYSDCTQGQCSVKNCTQVGFPISCPRIDPKYCIKGCLCKEGYARNEKGICVPVNECPSCEGDSNKVAGCGVYCNQRCRDIGMEPGACIAICYENACNCRDAPQCPENEWYSDCTQGQCSVKNCTQVGFPISCPRIDPKYCIKGCLCKEGYARNEKGICVPVNECPSCEGDSNKVAGCGVYCNQRCRDIGMEPGACIAICYENACSCRDGYFLDENTGYCVLPEHCTPQCPENEWYSDCTQGQCSVKNCTQVGFPISCPRIDPQYCIKGCLCKAGYARNEKGICVPVNECPSCGGDPNAEPGCGGNCNKHCYDIGKKPGVCAMSCILNGCNCKKGYFYDDNIKRCVKAKDCTPICLAANNEVYSACINGGCQAKNCSQYGKPIPCVKINPKDCIKGCLCKEGFLRASNGKCLPEKDCPEACNGPFEEYDNCSWSCPPQTCDSLDKVYACPIKEGDNCKPMCKCKPGYFRNKIGLCITEKQCRRCMGPHEYYNCGVACDNVCEDLHKQSQDNCPIINIKCNEMCYCEKNYARAKNNTCILISSCNEPQCPINERYEKCPVASCEPQYCSQLGFPIPCPAPTEDCRHPSKPGCVCIDGFVRDENGRCVLKSECPSCGGDKNAEPGCGVNCGRRCSDIGKGPVPCPLICRLNACDCKKGYYYDNNTKTCVKAEDCSPICLEQNNEVYSDCINGGCTRKNCSQYGKPVPCVKIDPKYCRKGCLCKEGFLRAANGKCILEKDCPEACNGPFEEYDNCSWSCPPQTCDSLDKVYACPIKEGDNCKPMCKCKPGYFRNKIGLCITEKQCRRCMGPHEYYNCGVACDNVCEDLHKQSQDNCPIINIKCNEMCYCEKNYARAKNNTCILISSCNEPQCPINERYEKCPVASCEPQYCSQLGFPIPCPAPTEDCRHPSKPGCVCIDGFVRDENGRCVLKSECPSCGGDKNAEPGCGVNCGRRCSDIGKGPVPCPLICRLNACDCKKGYYYDNNTKTCVKAEDCSPICLEQNNEVYSDCINGGCTPKNCSQYGKPVPCVKIDPNNCIKGCLCKKGFLRAANGKCIPEKDCPEACNGPNEEYNECSWNCPPQTCESLDRAYACLITNGDDCKPICRCKPGYFRNKIGQCITEKQCRKCMGPHEFYSCGGACDNVCKTLHEQNQTNCKIVNIKCNERCYCEKGYARALNNTCIPISCCNEPQAPLNERYEECPAASCEPQHCSQLGYPIPCPEPPADGKCPGKPGYVCIDGYVRNKNGKCIPKNECPSCGGDSNAQSGCGVNCGKHCRDLGKYGVACIEICYKNACDCKYGYYFDSNKKKCVLSGQCTDICNKNEVFENCSNPICRVKNCSQLGFPLECGSACSKECVCKEGYARNHKGLCIPVAQCPSCGGDTNAQSGCGVNCLKKCYDLENPDSPRPCPKICHVNACDCRKGFYLDENINKCVVAENCSPSCGKDEVYTSCVNGGCEKKNCSQLGEPMICIDPIKCISGCTCQEGFLRLKNGTCVPFDQCPTPLCNENERFELCPAKVCQPQRCEEVGFPISCFSTKGKCPGYPDCICNYGYVRNSEGICRPKSECPSCGGDENAQPGCGINCGKRCPNNNLNPKLCPRICLPNTCDCKDGFFYDINIKKCVKLKNCSPRCDELNNEVFDPCVNGGCGWKNCSQVGGPILCIDPIKCYKGCSCKEGYYKLNGTCVPENICPPPKCNENERFELCPAKVCQPQSCEEVGFPINCSSTKDKCPGYPDCICNYGYVRNSEGICRPKSECPSCGGDENAQPGCGINCGKRCPNNNLNPKLCPRICLPNTCDCKDGFFYDINIKKCVKLKNCSPRCDELNNEVFDPCVNGGCGWKNCSQVGGPILCIDPIKCYKGCSCKEGYYKLNGTCVPENKCPLKCKGLNEYFSCGPACDNVCSKLDKESKCNCPIKTFKCVPRCYCEDGYARNDKGICIPINDCPGRETTTTTTTTTTTQKPTTKPTPSTNATTAIANFERGNQALAGELLYQLLLKRPGENFMVSGFSLLLALAPLGLKADGVAAQQIFHLLNLENKDEIRTVFPILIKNYKEQLEVIFKLAVKYYSNENYPFSKEFIEETKAIFFSDVQSLNFSENEKAATTINDWVEDNTNGLIKNLVSADMFNRDTRCVLVNALYFLGNWEKQFNKNYTQPRDFYIDDVNSVSIETMYQEGKFEYAESDVLNCQILKLPYKGGNFSLMVYLPKERTGLPKMIECLRNPDSFADSLTLLSWKTVFVYLPLINFDTDVSDLPDLLKKLNITEAFKQGSNNFKGILENDEPLYISNAIQKTVIKIDETGTEAAAATAVILKTRSLPQPPLDKIVFNANHPFTFYLTFNNFIIFEGCFVH